MIRRHTFTLFQICFVVVIFVFFCFVFYWEEMRFTLHGVLNRSVSVRKEGGENIGKAMEKKKLCSIGAPGRFFAICWYLLSKKKLNDLFFGQKFQWKIASEASKKKSWFWSFFFANFECKKIVPTDQPLFGISSPVEQFFSLPKPLFFSHNFISFFFSWNEWGLIAARETEFRNLYFSEWPPLLCQTYYFDLVR